MGQCSATRDDGKPCGNWSVQGSEFCRHHGDNAAFSGRRWALAAVCLEEEAGAHFLTARYLSVDGAGGEKLLRLLGNSSELVDEWLTTFLLGALVPPPRRVYCRTPELETRLREWLSRLVVTLHGGQQVNGADLARHLEHGPPEWGRAAAQGTPLVRPAHRGKPLSYEVVPFDSSRANMQMVEALSRGREMKQQEERLQRAEGQLVTWAPAHWRAFAFDTMPTRERGDCLRGLIGFTDDPGEAIWNTLAERGALAVQAHFALWAHALRHPNSATAPWVTLSTNDLCDYLGFARLPGTKGHDPKNRRAAFNVFMLLTKIELHAVYDVPKRRGGKQNVWLHGPIWARGSCGHRNLSEAAAAGGEGWVPTVLHYQPGDWFSNRQWRQLNRHVGVVGGAFLGLDAGDRDKWAVLMGGYLAARAPVNGYATFDVKVETLCEATGMAAVYLPNGDGAKMRRKAVKALDRLQEAGVIEAWEFLKGESLVRVTWPAVLKAQAEKALPEMAHPGQRRLRGG